MALLRRYLRRLALVFVAWSVIYAVSPAREVGRMLFGPGAGPSVKALYWAGYQHLVDISRWVIIHPFTAALEGTKVHLWFLVALPISVAVLVVGLERGWERAMPWVAIAFYVFGLLGGSYAATALGVDLPFSTRDGPFFGLAFVVLGWRLAALDRRPRLGPAIAVLGLGLALQLAEAVVLWRLYGVEPTSHDYLIGTVPAGVGVLMVALARPDLGVATPLPALGRLTLGVYAAHYLLVDIFHALGTGRGAMWEIAFPLLVYALTTVLVALLARIPPLRPILT